MQARGTGHRSKAQAQVQEQVLATGTGPEQVLATGTAPMRTILPRKRRAHKGCRGTGAGIATKL